MRYTVQQNRVKEDSQGMGTVHMVLGILLIVLAVIATFLEVSRRSGVPKGLRGAVIGLLDLEVLLGIATWIFVTKPHSIWHPIFMVVGVICVHIFTRSNNGKSSRVLGWILADVLMILGAVLFR